jgi:hypothetical protein
MPGATIAQEFHRGCRTSKERLAGHIAIQWKKPFLLDPGRRRRGPCRIIRYRISAVHRLLML